MRKVFIVLIAIIVATTLMSVSGEKAKPLGELGYELADSLDVIINKFKGKYPSRFRDPRRLAMLRAKSNDTIYGSSWEFMGPEFGLPHAYVFWTADDTISLYGKEASPIFPCTMPDEETVIKNTMIALSGAEYNPEELGYFITYVIILKDGKFTITSGRGNEKPDFSTVTNY